MVKRRSYWSKKRRHPPRDGQTHREAGHVGTEAEAGARQVQAKERQGGQDPGEAGRGKEGWTPPWRLQWEPGP